MGLAGVYRRYVGKISRAKIEAFGSQKGASKNVLETKKTYILELFGKFFSHVEVQKKLKRHYNIPVSIPTLQRFRKLHKKEIDELQKDHQKTISDIRLGHKRSRLEELCWLYSSTKDDVEDLNDAKNRDKESDDEGVSFTIEEFVKLRALVDKVELDKKKFLVKIIETIKQEVEGDRLVIDGKFQIDIEHTVNEAVYRDLITDPSLSMIDIVISRLCARNNMNPLVFISKLHNSYYSKFNGFNELSEDFEDDITYPSSVVYDFNKLKKLNKLKMENGQETIPLDNPDTDKEKSLLLKDLLKKKLTEKQKEINDIKNNTNGWDKDQ